MHEGASIEHGSKGGGNDSTPVASVRPAWPSAFANGLTTHGSEVSEVDVDHTETQMQDSLCVVHDSEDSVRLPKSGPKALDSHWGRGVNYPVGTW